MCEGEVLTLSDLQEEGKFAEPYRTALVLKILGKTTGALLCALSLIDGEKGSYGRRIGQELEKDDNYIRQLLNILELIGILRSSEGKGKQKIFTLEEDLLILPKGQLSKFLEGNPVSVETLILRELENEQIRLEELVVCFYDEDINQIIHRERKEKFEVGQLIESMIKSGVVRTFETSSSKSLHHEGFLSFYQLLELLCTVKKNIPRDSEGNVRSSDLTRIITDELLKRDETGELARRYRDYVLYRLRKQIITDEGVITIDFSTLKELIDKTAESKGINLSAKMRNLLAEDVITSLKGLPITSFKESFIQSLIDNWLEDRFLITSSEEAMNQVETMMRVGDRLLENAKDIQGMDAAKATEFVAEASLNYLSLLLLLHGEIPPQKLSLMGKAFMKKKGDQSVFGSLVENFSTVRKDKKIKEAESFKKVKAVLEEKLQAFDVARFFRMYLKMIKGHKPEDFPLEDVIKDTEVVSLLCKLLVQFRMDQLAE